MKKYCLLILLFTGLAMNGWSQIMNIEKLRLKSDSGWAGNIKGSYNISKNTKKIKQLQTNVHIQHKREIHTFLIVSNLSFIKAGEENFENNGSQHFRYTRDMWKWMSVEGFAQFQYNRVLKVKFRNLWGAGVRFEAFDKENFRFYLGNIMMYEHERHENDDIENNLRLSYYINLAWKMKENINFNSITYIQPKMFDMGDYRVLWQSGVGFKVLKNLEIGIQYNWMIDSRPPKDVPKVIYSLRNTVSYTF